jgi:hypothetical protein
LEVRLGRHGSLDEQRHGVVLGERLQAGQVRGIGHRQGWDDELVLAAEMQRGPTGNQHLEVRARREEVGEGRAGVDYLLEVVQHQQQALGVQELLQALQHRPVAGFLRAEGLGNGGGDERRI